MMSEKEPKLRITGLEEAMAGIDVSVGGYSPNDVGEINIPLDVSIEFAQPRSKREIARDFEELVRFRKEQEIDKKYDRRRAEIAKKAWRSDRYWKKLKHDIERIQDSDPIEYEELEGVRRVKSQRPSGRIGDKLIVDIRPYRKTYLLMKNDKELKNSLIVDLKNFYLSLRKDLWKEIGSGDMDAQDHGVVPKDTGALRRSMRASISKNNVIVPEYNTNPFNVRLTMWLWANVPYADKLRQMDQFKRTTLGRRSKSCRGPPAVSHPIRMVGKNCSYLNYSKRGGRWHKKHDPNARPDFFNYLLRYGRDKARMMWANFPRLQQYFNLLVGTDSL